MVTVFVAVVLLAAPSLFAMRALSKAVDGHEDETGFHFASADVDVQSVLNTGFMRYWGCIP